MIGALENQGYRFGGVLRPLRSSLELPRDLDLAGACATPAEADCFWLQFSRNAATDGIALKAMELASAISKLRQFTGRAKVYLVTHSAGALVARAYLQSAFPDTLSFRHDVDRLITISAPHLGSALAEHWGDWLGTRATSLKTTASLLGDLNDEFDLPADVCFASIIVRGIWTDVRGDGSDYDHLVDQDFLDKLPVDFRQGGDQVLSVRTQNLRLARCAARYETSTGRAVQYVVARVHKQSAEMIHTAALGDRQVQQWVLRLLEDDGQCWQGFASSDKRAGWLDPQAASCAFAMLEEQTRQEHWGGGLESGKLSVACGGGDGIAGNGGAGDGAAGNGAELRYRYEGQATWRRHLVGIFSSQTPVTGGFRLTTDAFGRVRACQFDADPIRPPQVTKTPLAAVEF